MSHVTQAAAAFAAIAADRNASASARSRARVALAALTASPRAELPAKTTTKEIAEALRKIVESDDSSPEDKENAKKMLDALDDDDKDKDAKARAVARVLAANSELRREWVRAQKEAEINARLSPRERELLAKLDGPPAPTGAFTQGNTRFTPFATRAEAKRMLSKLDDEMAGVERASRDAEESGRDEVDALVRRGAGDPVGPSEPNYDQQLEDLKRRFNK